MVEIQSTHVTDCAVVRSRRFPLVITVAPVAKREFPFLRGAWIWFSEARDVWGGVVKDVVGCPFGTEIKVEDDAGCAADACQKDIGA